MTRFDRWLLYVANLLVGGTGMVYAWMRYILKPVEEFSIVNHPWQPFVQHAHVVVAPLLVFAIGCVWHHHAMLYLKSAVRPGRRSGTSMVFLALPMVLSGYLIQISVEESWRNAWIVVHVATSVLWLAGFAAHLFTHKLAKPAVL